MSAGTAELKASLSYSSQILAIMGFKEICFLLLTVLVDLQAEPTLELEGYHTLPNNTFIWYRDIGVGEAALNCTTNNNISCCIDSNIGGWRDGRGDLFQQEKDGASCLYVSRGYGVIKLNRKSSSCKPQTPGMWRCDIPDANGEMQSLYGYIGRANANGINNIFIYSRININLTKTGRLDGSVFIAFTLHTNPGSSVPVFTISCQTRGGPPTTVEWSVNETRIEEVIDHNTSQIVLDTYNVEYESRLLVKNRTSGNYSCSITNNIQFFLRQSFITVNNSIIIRGKHRYLSMLSNIIFFSVAGEPTDLTVNIYSSNSTHVNITMSWTAPPDPVTGYVIYYQSQRGPVTNVRVTSGNTEYSVDGFMKGITYNVSIVALSQYLPSALVGPVTFDPGKSLVHFNFALWNNIT